MCIAVHPTLLCFHLPLSIQSSTRTRISGAMEAIKNRLKQLEDIEARLYLGKEATVQRRAREDEQVQLKRQEEDRDLLETLKERDQEEDVSTLRSPIRRSMADWSAQELRRKRRILSRSSFGLLAANFRDNESQVTTDTEYGPGTRGRTKVKRSATRNVPSSNSGRREYGLPSARDSQGRDLFTRPWDGKLVYLLCCVPNCGRARFPNALALRNHVCSHRGLHKIKGLIKNNTEAIEVCGQVAPGQEESSTTARDQAFEAAPVANITLADGLLSRPAGLDAYQHQSKASSWSNTDTEAGSGATLSGALERFKAQDFGRAYRTRFSYNGGQIGTRSRADEAAEVFNGFMSSGSEDSDDSDDSEDGFLQGRKIPADRIDQHKAATMATRPSTCLQTGATIGRTGAGTAMSDSASVRLVVDAQAVKKERSTTPSLIEEYSEGHASAKHLTPNLGAEFVATRKRPSSAPPVTPPSITKRLRISDEKVARLVRS